MEFSYEVSEEILYQDRANPGEAAGVAHTFFPFSQRFESYPKRVRILPFCCGSKISKTVLIEPKNVKKVWVKTQASAVFEPKAYLWKNSEWGNWKQEFCLIYIYRDDKFGFLNGLDGGADLMSLQNPRGYPYENLANFLECRTKFWIAILLMPKSVQVCCQENERRWISSGGNWLPRTIQRFQKRALWILQRSLSSLSAFGSPSSAELVLVVDMV